MTVHFPDRRGAAPLVREIAPKSSFLSVNRSLTRYDFRAGAKAIRLSVNRAGKSFGLTTSFFVLGHFKGKLWNRLPRVHRISWRCRKEKDSYRFRGRFRLEPRRKRPQRSDFFENHRLLQLRFSRLEKFSERFRRTGTANSKGLLQIWSRKDKRMYRKGEKSPFLYGIAKWGSSSQTWQAT